MHARAAVLATGLGFTVWAAGAAPASADPGDPVDTLVLVPAPVDQSVPPPVDAAATPDPAAAPQTMLGQFAQAAQTNPLAMMQDLLAGSPQPAMIGLAPPAPGSAPVPDPYSMAQLLKPQNFRMPTDDQASPYALAPNDNPSPFARIDGFRGVYALTHSNLGRMPGDQLGQPLPGTAPPPGTAIPAGLEQFYAAPEPAPPSDAPVDPLLLPAVPPASPG
jgi:hypothetical protein